MSVHALVVLSNVRLKCRVGILFDGDFVAMILVLFLFLLVS